jgi:ABC-type taurine transport system substrate-binding protein
MNRTRIIFFSLIGIAVIGLGIAALLQTTGLLSGNRSPQTIVSSSGATSAPATIDAQVQPEVTVYVEPTSAPSTAPAADQQQTAQATQATQAAETAPKTTQSARLKPVWGPNYKENDGLGTIVCGAYAFSADYVLQQIQMSGLDIKRGFHLGIVPFYLNENYVVTAKDRADALENGTLDCLLTTFDLMALEDPGILTAFINESAGADQMWARGITSLNDLKGKRIAFEANGPSAFFVYDLLATVQLKPEDVTLLPQPDQNSAIAVFNKEEADAVAGWTPVIFDAEKSGGQQLASTSEFRSILGGIVMSRAAMQNKRVVIQLFHEAWFEALSLQEADFAKSSQEIAAWGNNDYLGVQKDTAEEDLRGLLTGVAQANLADNMRAFSNAGAIVNRLLETRRLWAANGHQVPNGDVTSIVNPEFVQTSARALNVDLNVGNRFVNNTFSLGRTAQVVTPAPATTTASTGVTTTATTSETTISQADILANAQAVATLPCSRFEFVPNTSQLLPASEQLLRDCALRALQQNVTLYVRVKGSSAWPGPPGTIARNLVELTAQERAQAVKDFFVAQGLNKDRFIVEWTMPPQDHWETTDVAKQAQDRYVELTLLVSGL